MFDMLLAIFSHTPLWVWGLLALLVSLGVRQIRTRDMTTQRLVVLPLAIGALSVWSACMAFAAAGPGLVLSSWIAGLVLGYASNRIFDLPHGCRANADGTYRIEGGVAPLVLMVTVFMLRYCNGVALAMDPALASRLGYVVVASFAFAFPSGLLAARSRKVLAAPRHDALAAA